MTTLAPLPDPTPMTAAAAIPSSHAPVWGPLGRLWSTLQGIPQETVAVTFVMALGVGVLLPLLGAVGFYDPWESHYAEVAREMVARDDYVHPHWKEHYFFSKPVLLFWMTATGFKFLDVLTGGMTGTGSMPELTELTARLPVALVALLCLYCVYRMVTRFFGPLAGALSGLVLITQPFFALVGRQHITDMPFVGFCSAGLCLMAESFFGTPEDREKPLHPGVLALLLAVTLPQYLQICRGTQLLQGAPDEARYGVFVLSAALMVGFCLWLRKHGKDSGAHLFYIFTGLATLAKGLPGILLPGLVFLIYTVVSMEWWRLRRVKAAVGTLIFLAVAAPWFVVMSLFTGKDDEGQTFATRFWVHDHLNRLTGGVHGERGTFEYYIKQLGFGTMPWVGLLPFAWLDLATPKEELKETVQQKVRFFIALWALCCFGLFSISTTKFHHYILPMVVPLSMAAGIYLAHLWETRRTPAMLVVMAMMLMAVVVGQDLWRNPHSVIDLFTYHYVSYKPDYYFPTDWPFGAAMGGVAFVCAALFGLSALAAQAPAIREKLQRKATGLGEAARWVFAEVVEGLLWLLELVTGVWVKPHASHGGRIFVAGASISALVSIFFYVGVYMPRLAPHWGQRYLFNTYQTMKQGDEPIIAYLMNWRGESFYARGMEPQINDATQLKNRCKQPGREFILVETNRYKGLESSLLPEFKGKVNIVDRSNQKWYLVTVDD